MRTIVAVIVLASAVAAITTLPPVSASGQNALRRAAPDSPHATHARGIRFAETSHSGN